MKKITKQGVDYIIVEDNQDYYVVNRLESPLAIKGDSYYLSNRKAIISKDEEYTISYFDENLLN